MQSTAEQQFEALTMPHVNSLFQTALQLTEGRPAAERVVREVYAAAWKSFRRRGGDRTDWRRDLFKTLFLVTRRRRAPWFSVGASPGDREPRASDPVTSALAQVPRPLREVLLLVDCQEFSYKEAADILGVPVDQVAETLVLGRNFLSREVGAVPSLQAARTEITTTLPASETGES